MIKDDINKLYRIAMIMICSISILGAFVLVPFSKSIPWLNPIHVKIIFFLLVTCSVFAIVTTCMNKFMYANIVILSMLYCGIGAFPQLGLSIIYLIPVLVACYTLNKKFIGFICGFNLFSFVISRIVNTFINISSGGPIRPGYSLKNAIVGISIGSFMEAILFASVSIPLIFYILNQNAFLRKSLEEKRVATQEILQFCSTATGYHNKYLTVHIHGVRDITKIILDYLRDIGYDISETYYDQIIFSVQFHDLGKIYIDSSILDKNGKLSDDEMMLVKEHAIRGFDLFNLLPKNVISPERDRVCKNVILQHHERLNGTGYPLGINGDKVSLEARVVAVADVTDALLSWRPYKRPMTWEQMLLVFEREKEGFDEDCLNAIFNNKEKILKISNRGNDNLMTLLGLSPDDIIR